MRCCLSYLSNKMRRIHISVSYTHLDVYKRQLQYCRSHSLRVPEDIMIAAVGDNRIGRVAYVLSLIHILSSFFISALTMSGP